MQETVYFWFLLCSNKNIVVKIAIINGPNLNLLGVRETEVYGSESFDSFLLRLQKKYPQICFTYFQSNVEGELVNKLQEFGFSYDGIVLNAGGYTHTSVAIADAVSAITTSVIEVHISNVTSRESYRHISLIAPNCKGIVAGFGMQSYEMAVYALVEK